MSEYVALKKVTCDACGGTGYTEDPTGFWRFVAEKLGEATSADAERLEELLEEYGLSEFPPEREACIFCDGLGYTFEYVDLCEALKACK